MESSSFTIIVTIFVAKDGKFSVMVIMEGERNKISFILAISAVKVVWKMRKL